MEFVQLLGVEQVENAGRNMSAAAVSMVQSASSISETSALFLRRLEDLVFRIEESNEKLAKAIKGPEWHGGAR